MIDVFDARVFSAGEWLSDKGGLVRRRFAVLWVVFTVVPLAGFAPPGGAGMSTTAARQAPASVPPHVAAPKRGGNGGTIFSLLIGPLWLRVRGRRRRSDGAPGMSPVPCRASRSGKPTPRSLTRLLRRGRGSGPHRPCQRSGFGASRGGRNGSRSGGCPASI
jgi:hypothetical protein